MNRLFINGQGYPSDVSIGGDVPIYRLYDAFPIPLDAFEDFIEVDLRVNLDLYWQKAPKLPDATKK